MSKIVVAKLVRLGQDGGVFKKELSAKTLRTSVKIDASEMEAFNKLWKQKGQLYILDEEATKKRDEKLKVENNPSGNDSEEKRFIIQEAEKLGHKLDGRKSLETLKSEFQEIANK